jgi:hypothetical protein
MPNLRMRQAGYERKQFIDHINALMQVAWQNSVVTRRLHKIIFDIGARTVTAQMQTDKKTPTGDIDFVSIGSRYLSSTYKWPENTFEFKNFYVNNRDELQLTLKEKDKGKIWFFIVPDGLAQPVIINILDVKQVPVGTQGVEFSLVLNPFSAQFKEYDTYQKPQ